MLVLNSSKCFRKEITVFLRNFQQLNKKKVFCVCSTSVSPEWQKERRKTLQNSSDYYRYKNTEQTKSHILSKGQCTSLSSRSHLTDKRKIQHVQINTVIPHIKSEGKYDQYKRCRKSVDEVYFNIDAISTIYSYRNQTHGSSFSRNWLWLKGKRKEKWQ